VYASPNLTVTSPFTNPSNFYLRFSKSFQDLLPEIRLSVYVEFLSEIHQLLDLHSYKL